MVTLTRAQVIADPPITTFTWTGAASSQWGDAANWSSTSNAFPDSSSHQAVINAGSTALTVDPSNATFAAYTVNRVDLSSTGDGSVYLGAGSGSLILAANGSTLPVITLNSPGAGSIYSGINTTLTLQADTLIAITSGQGTLLNGTIYQSANLQVDVANGAVTTFIGATAAVGEVTANFTKSGGGSLIVSTTLGHNGTTTIAGGTLDIGAPQDFFSVPRTIENNATLLISDTTGSETDTTQTGSLTGTGTLVKSGTTALTLAGENADFAGNITVVQGTLAASDSTNLGNGSGVLTVDGGTLRATGTFSVDHTVAIGGASEGGNIAAAEGVTLTLNGSLTGTGTLSKAENGTLALRGDNAGFAGNINLVTGELNVATSANLGSSASLLIMNGGTLHVVDSISTDRPVFTGAGGSIAVDSAKNFTLTADIGGSGALTKIGDGTLILTGNNTVGVDIYGGTLQVSSAANLGSNDITIDGGTLQTSGSFTTGSLQIGLGGATLSPDFGQTLAYNNSITGFGGGLIKTGGGTLVVSSFASWEPTGAGSIDAGTLVLGNGNWGAGALSVASGATLIGANQVAFGNDNTTQTVVSGTLSAGAGIPGSLYFNGTLTLMPDAMLNLYAGGAVQNDDYGVLQASDHIVLGGTLNFNFVSGYAPTGGETFDLFGGSSLTGAFTTLQLPGLGTGLTWDASALSSSGLLSVTSTPIPEPAVSSAIAALLGLAMVVLRRRRVG